MEMEEEQKIKLHIENWKMACKGREFELSHLWQRSIFLATFIVLVYTGYGAMWINIITKYNNNGLLIMANCISIFLAILGYTLSLLYIMMGKGSKYWYECYEKLIEDIEYREEYKNEEGENLLYAMCKVNDFKPEDKDKSLLSRNAGKFSVSKINICIGQVSAAVWIIIFIIHIVFLIYLKLFNLILSNNFKNIFIAIVVTFAIVITICITCCLKHKVESRD